MLLGAEPALSALADASTSYYAALETSYYQTTAMQAFLLVGTGDAISQAIEIHFAGKNSLGDEEGSQRYEPSRTLRMATLGLFIAGFGTAFWLQHLERALPGHASAERVLHKSCLDACLWAPLANTLYLVLVPLLEGKRPAEVAAMLRERFLPVMRTELSTFFPYNLLSFSLIDPLVRPFTTGFVSMCFAVYLSWVTHMEAEAEECAPGEPCLVGDF